MRLLGLATGVALLIACGPDRSYTTIQGSLETPTDPSDSPDGPDTQPDAPPLPPGAVDTDGDGLSDQEEIEVFNTNPNVADSDGDGLLDSDEVWWHGTDPNVQDTDGDGYSDAAEVDDLATNPLDSSSYPGSSTPPPPGPDPDTTPDPGPDPDPDPTPDPEPDPPADDCSGLVSTGNQIGQIAEDFTLTNQDGSTTNLHEHCDQLVLLVSSASWCGPCQAEAPHLQSLFSQYESQGLMVMTLLGEGDIGQWAGAFGLQHPVLQDSGYDVSHRFTGSGSFSIPTMHLIGPGGVVLARDSFVSESQIVNNLP